MKKLCILSSLVGFASLLTSCVVDPYGNVVAGGPVYVGGPGYYDAPYGVYGEPYFVYGSMHYYRHEGRYCYYDHGRRIYISRLPSGGHYYKGGSHYNKPYNKSYDKPYNKSYAKPSNKPYNPGTHYNTGVTPYGNKLGPPPQGQGHPGSQDKLVKTRDSRTQGPGGTVARSGAQDSGHLGKTIVSPPPKNLPAGPNKKKKHDEN